MAGFEGTRRDLLAAAAGALPAAGLANAAAQPEATLKLLDCCGSLQLTLRALEAFRRSPGSGVSRFIFQESPAAKMPDRIKPSGGSGNSEFDLVLTGADALVDGIDRGLWLPLLPQHAGELPDLESVLSEPARQMQRLARGQGVVTAWSPMGPVFNYMPARVAAVPRSAEQLLDWARAHPKRFTYPDPTLTDAGRAFLMGLPYLLGDSDAKDPEHGWSKTWGFLRGIGDFVESYAVSSGASFAKLQQGKLDICVSCLPDDLGSRMSAFSDPRSELIDMPTLHWVGAAYYAAIPRTAAAANVPTVLRVISDLLSRPAQAFAFGRGSFYPGPAVAGLGLDQASAASRELLAPAERPGYGRLIAEHELETPLTPAALRYAVGRWTGQIGAVKS